MAGMSRVDGVAATSAIRCGDAHELGAALIASRADTLTTFAVYEAALAAAGMRVPYQTVLNPPLWELGHIGWFQEFWLARNPQWRRGAAADPEVERPESIRAGGDALYNSSRVAHARRWELALPSADETRDDLARQLDGTLAQLARAPADDDSLYFFRLSLAHEDMHHEAAVYMAQTLGIDLDDPRWQPRAAGHAAGEIAFGAGRCVIGQAGPGFAFDNELPAHELDVAAFAIDRRAVRWAEYVAFVEAGGYDERRWWTEAGWRWRDASQVRGPRVLRRHAGGWQRRLGSCWSALEPDQAACHLNHHEAEAWCRWAGRRLPTEAEWERAAVEAPEAFGWGEVWEWTASAFLPFDGFEAHPYRDYSRPWFDGRPVLRGASFATQPRMRHPRYRNYFTPERNDIVAGFRSCAL